MRKTKLQSGQVYGHLTLIEKLNKKNKHGANIWLCKCECGNEKLVSSGKIRRGDSCGCVALKCNEARGLTGKRFGRLLVVERLNEVDKYRSRKYLCKCNCGNEKIMSSHNLIAGGVRSCGCLVKELGLEKLPFGEAAFNALYATYQFSAKRRSLDFLLSKGYFRNLTSQRCHFCGQEPKQKYKPKRSHGFYIYNGIDRLNSTQGYYEKNCVACCGLCNIMKMNRSCDEFLQHVCKIMRYRQEVAGG